MKETLLLIALVLVVLVEPISQAIQIDSLWHARRSLEVHRHTSGGMNPWPVIFIRLIAVVLVGVVVHRAGWLR